MDIEKLENSLRNIKRIKNQLNKINEKKETIEVRVFTKSEWTNIDFQPKNKAIYNMVIHQITMELEAELKQEKLTLKKLVELWTK